MNESLCDVCQTVFEGEVAGNGPNDPKDNLVVKRRHAHHRGAKDLRDCARTNCLLCAALWNGTARDVQTSWLSSDEVAIGANSPEVAASQIQIWLEVTLWWVVRKSRDCLLIIQPWSGSKSKGQSCHFETYSAGSQRPWKTNARKPEGLCDSTSSSATMERAKEWLKTCDADHGECKPWPASTSWLPTRLIQAGEPGQPSRLVISTTLTSRPRYTTLSHCWGTRPTLRLTSATISTLINGIPAEDMPETYADAIRVTRALGVEYIWIDSLCIIQDSTADWESECTLMADVYRHGYCNIAALEATDSHGGLFRDRDPAYLRSLIVESRWQGMDESLWEWQLHLHAPDIHWEINSAPVYTRGWVLQERTMSPRVLQFGRIMTYWNCAKLVEAESGRPVSSDHMYKGLTPKLVYRGTSTPEDLSTSNKNGFLRLWIGTVLNYSRATLTFRSDKFVAISALAREVQRILDHSSTHHKYEYLAGLWNSALEQQLMWARSDSGPAPPPTTTASLHGNQLTAPSWSWAAAEGPLSFLAIPESEPLAVAIGYEVVPRSGDPFLGVAPGTSPYLDMKGLCWILADRFCHEGDSDTVKSVDIDLTWDVVPSPSKLGLSVFMLPLTIDIFAHGGHGLVRLGGLLLEESSTSTSAFCRVGIFLIGARGADHDDFTDISTTERDAWLRRIIVVALRDGIFSPFKSGDEVEDSVASALAHQNIRLV